jgi:hypothetical protein
MDERKKDMCHIATYLGSPCTRLIYAAHWLLADAIDHGALAALYSLHRRQLAGNVM